MTVGQAHQCYQFHPHIQHAYSHVHQWLGANEDAEGYKDCRPNLDLDHIKHVAAHFHRYFPTHFFKVLHSFNDLIGWERIYSWFHDNPYICFVDVGCGAGAASAAFVQFLLHCRKIGLLKRAPRVMCVGVDPCNNALALFNELMKCIEARVPAAVATIEHRIVNEGVPGATMPLRRRLEETRRGWEIPCLPHIVVAQANIVRPLHSGLRRRQRIWQELADFGIDRDVFLADGYDEYGLQEVLTYRELMENVPVDHMHVVSIATDDPDYGELVRLMRRAIEVVFVDHSGRSIAEGMYRVSFVNPEGSFWRDQRVNEWGCEFHLDVTSVTSADWQRDKKWRDVVDESNLMLAWARVRRALGRESLVDEIEARLFEAKLDDNIHRLQRHLLAYAKEVMHREDRVAYAFPKNDDAARPRVLSRMEEEILSVAIIQLLGPQVSGLDQSSYAYRLNRGHYRDTEFLYDHWWNSYEAFTRDAKEEAAKHRDGAVVRTDLESYYARIEQERLLDISGRELGVASDRIRWLLRCLLLEELPEEYHRTGYGIPQGGVGSGFYANLYMIPIDAHFGANHPCHVKMYRYMDDMIVVIPDADDKDKVLQELRDQLGELELTLNEKKTSVHCVPEYLAEPDRDEELDALSDRFRALETPLWVMDSAHRSLFVAAAGDDDDWWGLITKYAACLKAIGFHSEAGHVSRKIWQYLWDEDLIKRDLPSGDQLRLPPVDDGVEVLGPGKWAEAFRQLNHGWLMNRDALCNSLVKVFRDGCRRCRSLAHSDQRQAALARRRLRFSVNRLRWLGLGAIRRDLEEILLDRPWLLRQPRLVVEALARQGGGPLIRRLLDYYRHSDDLSAPYMRTVALRAMRYLPHVEASMLEFLMQVVTDGTRTASERLVATESWLYLSAQLGPDKLHVHPELIDKLLEDQALPTRLRKNYTLILGMGAPQRLSGSVTETADPILHLAYETASEGEVQRLLVAPEPQVLREGYYSGKYPDYVDDAEFSF